MSDDAELGRAALAAIARAVDPARLGAELARALPAAAPREAAAPGSASPAASGAGATARAVLERIVLSDILDDAILGARPSDPTFPLRTFFGTLGDELDDDVAFALANGLNFFFRVGMPEEARMLLGLEVSHLYYRYATERPLEDALVPRLSPLLARLMSTELRTLAFEARDTDTVFDSALHERELGSQGTSGRVLTPKTFLCRVLTNGRVRAKARVRT